MKEEAKKKSQELIDKYYNHTWQSIHDNMEGAKQCALIHVNEMIKEWDEITSEDVTLQFIISKMEFWESVKSELELL